MTTATPTPTPTPTPTAPLPQPAAEALARLGLAFAPLDVVRAVTRYEIACERRAELLAKRPRDWSGAEFDSFTGAERTIEESKALLAAKELLHLIGGELR
ncbi:hypothetical protein AB5J55_35235 [Streptomyces sp. R11]|uniref:Uncharacterized protein n=1 Tax=Streptomyces sp. R11 TaxID=3238625 RepID=A0AB39N9F4_9ACTN